MMSNAEQPFGRNYLLRLASEFAYGIQSDRGGKLESIRMPGACAADVGDRVANAVWFLDLLVVLFAQPMVCSMLLSSV